MPESVEYDLTFRETSRIYPMWAWKERGMRIEEDIKKSVVFLGIKDTGGAFVPYGTAFLLLYPMDEDKNAIGYVVTAKHVMEDIRATKRPSVVRLNKLDGTCVVADLGDDLWQVHPSNPLLDIVVGPIAVSFDTFDILGIDVFDNCITDEYIKENDVGSGDEVFTVGLLVSHFGTNKNIPVARIGNIATMPEEPVDLGDPHGPQEVYLIESRSIGGLSGSPVFFHTPLYKVKDNKIIPSIGHRKEYLMGVNIGLFETQPSFDSIPKASAEKRQLFLETMSAGIAVVVPIQRVLEILELPIFTEHRAAVAGAHKKSVGFVTSSAAPSKSFETMAIREEAAVESATDNPSHKEDFMRLQDAALKAK